MCYGIKRSKVKITGLFVQIGVVIGVNLGKILGGGAL